MQAGTDQIIQPIGRWYLQAMLDQEIHAAEEDQTGFEMHPRHLSGKCITGRFVKGFEPMEIQNDLLMPLPCLLGMSVRDEFKAPQP